MKKTSQINIRIGEKLKEEGMTAANEIGMSLSEYVIRQIQLLVHRKELRDHAIQVDSEIHTGEAKGHFGINALISKKKP